MSGGTILCMFSGGIDSAGVLHKLMSDEEYQDQDLIVHHIVLQNRENRAVAEIEAVKKILAFYQKNYPNRPYTYTESLFNTEGFAPLRGSRFPFDMDVCAFTAANIAVIRKDIRQVAMGRTKTDIETSTNSDFQSRMARAQSVFQAVYSLESDPAPSYIFPVKDMTKEEIWNYLPEDIRNVSWYCRRPVYKQDGSATPCQKCSTCKTMLGFLSHG